MDLIANIMAWVFTLLAGILGNVVAHDLCVSADRTCTKIIRYAARRLAPFDRESGELEWLADLNDRVTVREKYRHAIGCFLVAGKMRRQAQTVVVTMNFKINGVGTVPLTLNLTSRFMVAYFAALRARFYWIKYVATLIGMLYLLFKFVRSADGSLSPGFRIRQEHLKQYKGWGYEAHIRHNGLDLNLSKVFHAMILHPKRIPEILKKVSEILAIDNRSAPSA